MSHVCLILLALFLATPASAQSVADHETLQQRIIQIAEGVSPSVVHIEAIIKVNDRRNQVTGSGVIASADGLILTNQHVVEKAEKAEVVIPGRTGKLRARILGTDKQTDIAVLKVESDQSRSATPMGWRGRSRSGSCPPRGATSRSRTCSTTSSRPMR
jgi:S1-C subfamily serine protease